MDVKGSRDRNRHGIVDILFFSARAGSERLSPQWAQRGLSILEGRVRKMRESTARRDAAVQFVTKPEIKQHRE